MKSLEQQTMQELRGGGAGVSPFINVFPGLDILIEVEPYVRVNVSWANKGQPTVSVETRDRPRGEV